MLSNKNILLLSAGRRVDLLQAFKKEAVERNISAKIFATDLKPYFSAACHVSDKAFSMPRVTEEGYIDKLLDLCVENKVGVVVPTIDTELLELAENRNRFESEGINLIISDEKLISLCRDKRNTAEVFEALGISTPRIMDSNELSFPCFAKPYDGSRSVGAVKISKKDELTLEILNNEKLIFMEYIDHTYDEYTIDAYYDRFGEMRCLVPRQRIEVRDGEVNKGVTRKNEVYEYLLSRLNNISGARGCLTLQIFFNKIKNNFAALEINPRFGGGYPLSYAAGANYPGWLIDEYILNKNISFFDAWEDNLLMLRYDSKVLVHDAVSNKN